MKPPRASTLRSERGVSLVEVVVAGMLLSITLLGLAGAAGLAARQTYSAERDMELWAAVQWEVDSLMAANWSTLAAGSDTLVFYIADPSPVLNP